MFDESHPLGICRKRPTPIDRGAVERIERRFASFAVRWRESYNVADNGGFVQLCS